MQVVKYKKDIEVLDGTIFPVYEERKVYDTYIKRYRMYFYRIVGITNTTARDLMEFVVEFYGYIGSVTNNQSLRDGFNNELAKAKMPPKSYSAINHSFKILVKADLLIQIGRTYKINPEYFFTGQEHERIERIRIELELKYNSKVNRHYESLKIEKENENE
jgi:hypothetical protein